MEDKVSYALVDSGLGRKLERFGPYLLDRPCTQAIWRPKLSSQQWAKADACFTREGGKAWLKKSHLPEHWLVEIGGLCLKASSTDFGHLGIFPEHASMWCWIRSLIRKAMTKRQGAPNILNLFAYSGGATLSVAAEGAKVCHVDSSKGMIDWAKENAANNQLSSASIRWIVEDVNKFLSRELRRGVSYDGIILDPPTFGRGRRGEVFKIEEHILEILDKCRSLLSENPLFVLFSCHTPGYTPLIMEKLLKQALKGLEGEVEYGEMFLPAQEIDSRVPSGTYSRWFYE